MSPEVIDEVQSVLSAADRPLTTTEVYAQTELAEGRATVAGAINTLVRRGSVREVPGEDGGPRRFAADEDRTARKDRRLRTGKQPGQTTTHRVMDAVTRAAGPVTTSQLAEVLGMPRVSVQWVMANLKRQGHVRSVKVPGQLEKLYVLEDADPTGVKVATAQAAALGIEVQEHVTPDRQAPASVPVPEASGEPFGFSVDSTGAIEIRADGHRVTVAAGHVEALHRAITAAVIIREGIEHAC